MHDTAKKALEEIREACWGYDIPSPCCPEYQELHAEMQALIELCDKWLEKLEDEAGKEWILCADRLPENNEECAVVSKWIDDEGCECIEYNIARCFNAHWYGKTLRTKVIAWMPLPEPYAEEGDEK